MTWTVNVDRSLVILPLFFTYLFGSFASLRVWLAVQKIPQVTKAEVNEDITIGDHDTKRYLIRLMPFPTVFFALVYFLSGDSSYTIIFWRLFVVSLVFVTAACVMQCVMDVFGLRRSVHRNAAGILYIKSRFIDHSWAWRWLGFGIMVLSSVLLPVITLWYNSDVGASIMAFSLLYAVQAINNPRTTSMRQMIIAAIVIEAVLFLYFASLLAIIVSTVQADRTSIEQLYEHFTAYSGDFTNWFYVPCMGLPLSFIISMSLRLDFANHIARVQLYQDRSADFMMLEEVSTPEAKSSLTTGIVIPSSIPVAFDCPYFLSTLLAWIFTNTAIMQLLAHGWLPDFGHFVYSLYVFLCGLPMVVVSVVGVSLARGEARRMWMYKEHWNLEPVEQKALGISEKVRELIDLKVEHV